MNYNQQLLFDLLVEIDEICRRHDIEYILDYGTMLGAVRHEGFIPWDADIDISMAEDDYNRFVEACEQDLDHVARTFCDNRRNRSFPVVFGHFINLETCRMSGHTAFWENLCGQHVDVFCRLELPGDPKLEREAINRFFAYDEFVNRGYRHFRYKPEEVMDLYREYEERARVVGREALLQELESQIFNQHHVDCRNYLVASANYLSCASVFPKSAFDNPVEVLFEGHPFRVPGNYVTLLTLYYGEAFSLFPENPPKYTEASEHGIPCSVYVGDEVAAYGRENLMEMRASGKDAAVEEGYRWSSASRAYYAAFSKFFGSRLHADIAAKGIDVHGLAVDGSEEAVRQLSGVFSSYYRFQNDKGLMSWKARIDIGDDYEYAALLALARTGRRDMARAFLELRWHNGLGLTSDLEGLVDEMDHYLAARECFYHGDYEAMVGECEWLGKRVPESGELKTLRALAMAYSAGDKCSKAIAYDVLCDVLLESGGDIQLLKAKADLLFDLGRVEEAAMLYELLRDGCKDGMILLDIDRKERAAKMSFREMMK